MNIIDGSRRRSFRGFIGASPLFRGRAVLAAALVGAAVLTVAPSLASAQVVVTSRVGENIVYCGEPSVGPSIDNRFLTPAATDDSIAVSDLGEGKRPPTSASAHLVAFGLPGQVSISVAGSSQRGSPLPFGAYAVADGRDQWNFTLSEPKPFRLTVSLKASTTDATLPTQGFSFVSFAGGLDLSNGTTVFGLTQTLTAPGEWSMTFSGTIRAGSYSAGLFGRSEGNSSPFLGSFDHSLRLSVGCPADFDGDGFVTGDDFDAYVGAFENGDAGADFDGDGFVTGDDFDAYVAAFEVGC